MAVARLLFRRGPTYDLPDGSLRGTVGIVYRNVNIGHIEYTKRGRTYQPCIIRLKAEADEKSKQINPECDWKWVELNARPATINIAKQFIRMHIEKMIPHVAKKFLQFDLSR